eukprot:GSMAST32.ASY1.ANO1.1125.1 assembled CDS
MSDIVELINTLQDAMSSVSEANNDFEMDLPAIAVVGGQSAGKSSVLEAFVLRNFVPNEFFFFFYRKKKSSFSFRFFFFLLYKCLIYHTHDSNGCCTRRPLVLTLVKTRGLTKEYGEFRHLPNRRFDIFTKPIFLKIYSADVLNLTVIDLPGITRVPMGNQPDNIEEIILLYLMNFKLKNTYLFTIHHTCYIALSDALQLAHTVDPSGERTLGVLTKLDLMDRGTDAFGALTGQGVIPLKLGYIGVVNRSQADLQERVTLRTSQRAESNFFKSHPKYSTISAQCGSAYLAKRLNQLLLNSIVQHLPKIQRQVSAVVQRQTTLLDSLVDVPSNARERAQLITKTLTSYSMEPVCTRNIDNISAKLHLRIKQFVKQLDDIDIMQVCSKDELRKLLGNTVGTGLFAPGDAFERVIRKGIKQMRPFCEKLIDDVINNVVHLVSHVTTVEMTRYTQLGDVIRSEAGSLVRNLRTPTDELVDKMISMELVRINNEHPNFIGQRHRIGRVSKISAQVIAEAQRKLEAQEERFDDGVMGPVAGDVIIGDDEEKDPDTNINFIYVDDDDWIGEHAGWLPETSKDDQKILIRIKQQTEQKRRTEEQKLRMHKAATASKKTAIGRIAYRPKSVLEIEEIESRLLKLVLNSYFGIVRKKIQDSVPKAILLKLIGKLNKDLEISLYSFLFSKKVSFASLLSDTKNISGKKERIQLQLKKIHDAENIIVRLQGAAANSFAMVN